MFIPSHLLPASMRTDLGAEGSVREGEATCVTANGKAYALFRVAGKIYCLDNQCTHLGGPLCRGRLDGSIVQCPWHGSRFDVRTGAVVGPPARNPVKAHLVTVEGGRAWADLP